ALLFRLQRHGVPAPRVLAMGQRRELPWRLESFLLTEPAADAVPLDVWLRRPARGRRRVLREAGALLARLHQASCYFHPAPAGCPLAVRPSAGDAPEVVLCGVEDVYPRRRTRRDLARRDVSPMRRVLDAAGCEPGAGG